MEIVSRGILCLFADISKHIHPASSSIFQLISSSSDPFKLFQQTLLNPPATSSSPIMSLRGAVTDILDSYIHNKKNAASGGTVNVSEARKEIVREIDAHLYWNQIDTSKHHFFKIMTMNNFRTELRIPKKFVMNSPLELKETVELVGPTKDVWGVRVVKTEEGVLFEQGWGQFVIDHHLNMYDLLVFHYIGDSTFEVWIFDPSGCQKDLRLIDDQLEIKPHFFKVMNMEFRSELLIPVMLVKNFPDKFFKKVTLKGPSGNVWEVGSERIGAEMFLLKGWDEFVSDHDVDEKNFLIFRYTGNSSFTVLIFEKTGCEKQSAHFVEPRVKLAHPRKGRKEKGKGKRPEGCTGCEDRERIPIGNTKMKGKMGVKGRSEMYATNRVVRLPLEVTREEIEAMRFKRSQRK